MQGERSRASPSREALVLGRVGADWLHLAQVAANEESRCADFLERLLVAEAEARGEQVR